jgi:CRISPR/Cas system-associated exonuclease Cas4 (RecB family)
MANKLAACPLRVAFDLDLRYQSLRRPSIAATLGTIVHETTEAATKQRVWPDDPASRRVQVEALWAHREADGRAALERAWSPALPPPLADWSGYEMKRVRTVRRILRSLPAVSGDVSKADQPERNALVEQRVDDAVSGLYGWPDRVEVVGDAYRVIDLKSGMDQGDPSDAQRRQLLLYAVLVHRKYGHWPVILEIQDLSGSRWPVAYRPLDAESALREVEDSVVAFNRAITEGRVLSLALPGPDQCRSCPYRVVCPSYWKHLSSQWEHQSVMGMIISSQASGHLNHLVLEVASPIDRRGQIVHVTGLELEHAPDGSSNYASITDLSGTWVRGNLHGRWSTMTRLWK